MKKENEKKIGNIQIDLISNNFKSDAKDLKTIANEEENEVLDKASDKLAVADSIIDSVSQDISEYADVEDYMLDD